MLQQTQVATVIPYYQRFLKSFPNVKSLAKADEQDLLSHWEGLGYYRRARSMHAAAKEIVANHSGQFPESYKEVLALPGIGRYTAGAVLSISLNQRLPILEGNTQRVFSRWISLRTPATERPANELLWQVAEQMLPRKEAGKFNQAAMELGALICTPKNPDCPNCPVARLCQANKDGLQSEIPGKISRVKYEDRTEFALVVNQGDRYLLRPLPEGGRWAGLWDFPRITETELDSADDAAREISLILGSKLKAGVRLSTIRHAVTKFRISLHVHEAEIRLADPGTMPTPWKFLTLKEVSKLPMSVTGRKIAKLLSTDRQPKLPL